MRNFAFFRLALRHFRAREFCLMMAAIYMRYVPLNHKMAPTKNDVVPLRGELVLDWIQF